MADSFDPRVYGCRINLEHLKSYSPDSTFRRYGDVSALKAETIEDDSILNGKRALFAQISPTDDLVQMNKALQKIYTSMEIRPNFANTGKAYLVGLAVTDDPASLGTEMLEFSAKAKHNPLMYQPLKRKPLKTIPFSMVSGRCSRKSAQPMTWCR
nr:capsid scaffolding protein [Yersinia enterocolitica]